MRRFFLLLLALTVLASYGYADVDSNAWWTGLTINELFYESCADGNLANWSGETDKFTDSQNIFKYDGAGIEQINKDFSSVTATDFNFFVRMFDTGNNILFFSDSTSTATENNHHRLRTSAIQAQVETMIDGATTALITVPFNFASNLAYDFNIERDALGFWHLWIDGNFQGTSAWPDTNFTTGDWIVLHSVGGSFDDVSLILSRTDVNLAVLPAINEDTGAVIDTNTYSFTVKVLDDETLTTTTDIISVDYFSIPVGSENLVIVTVDTNVPTDFYSRSYAFQFPLPQSTETLQPFLPPVAESILTTIHTVSKSGLENIPDQRIKVFKNLAGGRTLVHDVTTDEKGETVVPFIIADEYEIEVFDEEGNLVKTLSYTATATTTDFFIYITSIGEIDIPILKEIYVIWSPSLDLIDTFDAIDSNVTATITSLSSSITASKVWVENADINVYVSESDTSIPADGNNYSIILSNIPGTDTTSPFDITVLIDLDDGNQFVFQKRYIVDVDQNMFQRLTVQMKADFGCQADIEAPCPPLMIVTFFIILFILGGITVGTPIRNGAGLTIIALIFFAMFAFIGWIPFWMLIPLVIIGFASIGLTARGSF